MTLLILLHLLAAIVWVGGMVFAHFCLRPASMELAPAVRIPLMIAALGRFFNLVIGAIVILLFSGVYLLMMRGGMAHVPLGIHLMLGLGVLMMLIFGHIYMGVFRRARQMSTTADWVGAAGKLNQIRVLVAINMMLGVVAIAAVKLLT
ncbi:CopD family protein [Ampullimonas aquatilis]|uniref:CopD family protein n=1 Tax=Ampullimonas aquatilis TaxID=1341549 RepID=UPI003C73A1CE